MTQLPLESAKEPAREPAKESAREPARESAKERANQKVQLRKQQEKLLSDLLTVVDLLDRAADHWKQAELSYVQTEKAPSTKPLSLWQRVRKWFEPELEPELEPEPEPLTDVVISAREGVDMIRETMLSVLSWHQVVPLPAQGMPFDPEQMHALGQQADASALPNTVVQEVVRGYRWKERVLREAQVIVAGASIENGFEEDSAVEEEEIGS